MSSKRFFISGLAIVALSSGLSGCGSSGPSAGIPADAPKGVAPVMSADPIRPGDAKKPAVQNATAPSTH